MLNPFVASVSTFALLVGFVGAPHTHLHPQGSGAASGSGHEHAVVHSHVTSHAKDHGHEHAPASADSGDADGLSVDAFVFQIVKNHALTDAPVVLPEAATPRGPASIWTRVDPSTPSHYGSPPILSPASRAPPSLSSRTA